MDWTPAITATGLFASILWLGRHLIANRLTQSVKHEYESKLEILRSELAASQKSVEHQMKTRESEIDALRQGALSGLASRQNEIFKKRLLAVEQLWGAVLSLSPGKYISHTMSLIKFDDALKITDKSESFKKFFEAFSSNVDPKAFKTIEAHKVRPFVSKMTWAYFSAYSSIVAVAYLRMQTLQFGMGMDFTNKDSVLKLIRAALPHQEKLIIDHGFDAIHYLLDELEEKMLIEFDKVLQGTIDDKDSVERAAEIIKAAGELNAKREAVSQG